jgi:hypothetical protein
MNNITNPISSNQVTNVNLLKPACADFCGKTLNDWLKWLADQHCKYDWTALDLTCLQEITDSCPDCDEGNLKKIIEKMLLAICAVNTKADAIVDCCSNNTYYPTLDTRWALVSGSSPIKARLNNGVVHLDGQVTSGSSSVQICTLPVDIRPLVTTVVPIATSYPVSDLYKIDLEIRTTGLVIPKITGAAPAWGSYNLYLTGVTYFID